MSLAGDIAGDLIFRPSDPYGYALLSQLDDEFREIGARYGAYSMILRRSGIKTILDFFKRHQIFMPYDIELNHIPDLRLFTLRRDVVSTQVNAISDNGSPPPEIFTKKVEKSSDRESWSECDLLNATLSVEGKKIVLATKRISLNKYPEAYNPSIIQVPEGLLLTFRYVPDLNQQPWLSYIGIVLLNDLLEPISEPELLDTRLGSSLPSQSEDARIFSYAGRIYLIFNNYTQEICYSDHSKKRYVFGRTPID